MFVSETFSCHRIVYDLFDDATRIHRFCLSVQFLYELKVSSQTVNFIIFSDMVSITYCTVQLQHTRARVSEYPSTTGALVSYD